MSQGEGGREVGDHEDVVEVKRDRHDPSGELTRRGRDSWKDTKLRQSDDLRVSWDERRVEGDIERLEERCDGVREVTLGSTDAEDDVRRNNEAVKVGDDGCGLFYRADLSEAKFAIRSDPGR